MELNSLQQRFDATSAALDTERIEHETARKDLERVTLLEKQLQSEKGGINMNLFCLNRYCFVLNCSLASSNDMQLIFPFILCFLNRQFSKKKIFLIFDFR